MDHSGLFEMRRTSALVRIEEALEEALTTDSQPGEIARPARLRDAMAYAVLGGGKRIRPLLVLESAALFDAPFDFALHSGIAFELLHGYSLIHDDLPAMDDDDTRRGRPSLHRAFDEATAILAGDALQTLAFDILSRETTHPDPVIRAALVQCLAKASGIGGMAGGQMLDLEAEGRFERSTPRKLSLEEITRLQRMKTGALLAACCEAGAILGKASARETESLRNYGRTIGLAFQIADDLLDAEGDTASVGKAVGKDAEKGKGTFVSLLGLDGAKRELGKLVMEAKDSLSAFGERGRWLRVIAQYIAERKS